MISGIFEGIQFVLDTSSFTYVPFKKKLELRKQITDNGGIISYTLTKKSNIIVLTADVEKTVSSYKGSTAMKYGVPVVHMDFVADCILAGIFLDPTPHLVGNSIQEDFSSGKISAGRKRNPFSDKNQGSKIIKVNLNNLSMWLYKDPNGPQFPEKDYKIAKDMILKKTDANGEVAQFFAIELHVIPSSVPCENPRYRIFTHHGSLNLLKRNDKDDQIFKECYYSYTAEEAMGIYVALHDKINSPPHDFERAWSHLSYKIGSDKMKERCIEVQETSDGVPPILEVTSLVDYLWKEAIGCLSETLAVPVESLKLQTVQEAEAVLASMKECFDNSNQGGQEIRKLWKEFCQLIPHEDEEVVFEESLIAEKQNLCQLIRDVVTVSEATNMCKVNSQIAKYRALRCHIEHLDEEEEEFERIKNSVVSSLTERSRDFRVLNIFSLNRPVEESNFTHHLENKKLIYHASRVSNFVGILSRGLLLPKIIVDDLGGKRSDPGMLGSGIYFASSASTSAKYSARGSMGSRFMLINEVALGRTKRYRYFDKELETAPEGYHSTHGVAESSQEPSDFKDDEFVIYNANQQRMRYLVEFSLDGEYVRKRHLDFAVVSNLDPEPELLAATQSDEDVDVSDVTSIVDPLSKVEGGLKGSGDQSIPLRAVHIRAKLLDLVAQVSVLQSYKNDSNVPIEAKYVFPLDDMAAVCGFEAYINDKHVIGEVKEKKQAHKEYREAITKGHGAYLMDEETPDIFTVSVGNLPPNASVLIKISYIVELFMDGEHISFSLPGSVAPWKRSMALDDVTQTDVETVRIEEEMNTTIQVAIEMPFDIRTIQSPTHPVRIKRTATKAVVELEPGHVIGDGFQLLIGLAEIHVPRMWVESHETKHDSEAGMLVFYPEFEAEEPDKVEVLFCLDASCSMKGSNLKEAKKILQMCIHFLPDNWLFNIVVFGSYHSELFTNSQQKRTRTVSMASDFIKSISAHKGGTELWRTLESLSLIPSMSTTDQPRNVFIISDGHVTEESTTLALVRQGRLNTRVFTLGVGPTGNRHMLRSLAQVGAGASEFFNSKTKSKWERKVKTQLYKAGQPGLTSVSVNWQQHDNDAKPPIQAPREIVSLFNGSRLVVYGFVSNCTQAFLTAEVNGREISTMVSTSDMSITRGKILHQLVARGLIKDWEEGNLDKDHTKHEVLKRDTKDYIISISKDFSIVSQFTSFIAVEKREKDEMFYESRGPNIQELVAVEDVDIIPYISWEEDRSRRTEQKEVVQTTDDKVLHLLNEAKDIENFSVLQAEGLYKNACDLVIEKRQDCTRLIKARAFLELSNFYSTICHDDQKRSAVIDLLIILASEEDDDPGDKEVIQELTDIFGMEKIRGIYELSSESSFHPKRSLILEIFPDSEYGWSRSVVDDYESSITESTESRSRESDSSFDEEEADEDRLATCLQSRRKGIEDEENAEEIYEDSFDDDWSDSSDDNVAFGRTLNISRSFNLTFDDATIAENEAYEDMDIAEPQEELNAEIKTLPWKKKSKSQPSFSFRASSEDVQELDQSVELSHTFDSQMEGYQEMETEEGISRNSTRGVLRRLRRICSKVNKKEKADVTTALVSEEEEEGFLGGLLTSKDSQPAPFRSRSGGLRSLIGYDIDIGYDRAPPLTPRCTGMAYDAPSFQGVGYDHVPPIPPRLPRMASASPPFQGKRFDRAQPTPPPPPPPPTRMAGSSPPPQGIEYYDCAPPPPPPPPGMASDSPPPKAKAEPCLDDIYDTLSAKAEPCLDDIYDTLSENVVYNSMESLEPQEELNAEIKTLPWKTKNESQPSFSFRASSEAVQELDQSIELRRSFDSQMESYQSMETEEGIYCSVLTSFRERCREDDKKEEKADVTNALVSGGIGLGSLREEEEEFLGGLQSSKEAYGRGGFSFGIQKEKKAKESQPALFGSPSGDLQCSRESQPALFGSPHGGLQSSKESQTALFGSPSDGLKSSKDSQTALFGSPSGGLQSSTVAYVGGGFSFGIQKEKKIKAKEMLDEGPVAASCSTSPMAPPPTPADIVVSLPPPILPRGQASVRAQPPLPKPRRDNILFGLSKTAPLASLDKPAPLKCALGQPKFRRAMVMGERLTTSLVDGLSPPPSTPDSPASQDISEPERVFQEKLLEKVTLEEKPIRAFRRGLPSQAKDEVTHVKGIMRKSKKKRCGISFKQQLLPRTTPKIEEFFKLQNPEGYWSMDDAVFSSIGLDTNKCIVILKDAGAKSLGAEVFDQIARFFATVLMLFLLRSHFPSVFLFSLDPWQKTETEVTSQKWKEQISEAFRWLIAFDKKIPSLCWRLELGNDWELAANLLNSECIDSDSSAI